MFLFNLSPRWRILYCIYNNTDITADNIYNMNDFQDITKEKIDTELNILINENIIKNERGKYSIISTESDPFLRVLHLIFSSAKPLSRTEIRYKMKHKSLKDILDNLVASNIFYEYRTELNRTIFVIPTIKKEEYIAKILSITNDKLSNSVKLEDQSHLIMIKNNYSIIDSYTTIDNLKNNGKREQQMIKKIINSLSNRTNYSKTGLTFEEVCNLTGYTKKENTRIILLLVSKGIIKCSRRNLYYINNSLIQRLLQ